MRLTSGHARAPAGPCVCVLAVLSLLLMWGACGPAWADSATVARSGASSGQKIGVFEDVVVEPGETWGNVVVIGADAVILGTVENLVVVVGGDALIRAGAHIGRGEDPDDAAVVAVFGSIRAETGASVKGRTVVVGSGFLDRLSMIARVGAGPGFAPWHWTVLLSWAWWVVFLTVMGVVATAVCPGVVVLASDQVRHHFFSCLGWGALALIVVVPVVTVLLVVSLFGIPLALIWLGLVVPGVGLFGFISVGTALGRLILRARHDGPGRVMLAAVLGILGLSVLWWIPVAGPVILFLLGLVGAGASCLAVWDWGRRSAHERQQRRPQVAAGQQGPRL